MSVIEIILSKVEVMKVNTVVVGIPDFVDHRAWRGHEQEWFKNYQIET